MIPKNPVFESDIWSLGCILFALVTRKSPFSGNDVSEMKLQLQNFQIPPLELYSPFFRELLVGMLRTNPILRISLEKIKNILSGIEEEKEKLNEKMAIIKKKEEDSKKEIMYFPKENKGILNYFCQFSLIDIRKVLKIVSISTSKSILQTIYDFDGGITCNGTSKLIFNFQQLEIKVTNYFFSLLSKTGVKWVLEGTNDEKEWTILDQKDFSNLRRTNSISDFYQVSRQSIFQIVALTIESSDEYFLKKFDFFGELIGHFAIFTTFLQNTDVKKFKKKGDFPYCENNNIGLFSVMNRIPFHLFSKLCEIESSLTSGNSDVSNLLIWDNSSWTSIEQSPGKESSVFINIRFWKKRGFYLTGYRLRVSNKHFPTNWEFIGISMKNEIEQILDRQSDCKVLCGDYFEKSFRIIKSDYYNSIKIKFKGTNYEGEYRFSLTGIELFGHLMKML